MRPSIFADSPFAHRLLEISPAAILVLDEQGYILYSNRRLTEWLGFSANEILGKSMGTVFPGVSLCDLTVTPSCHWSHNDTLADGEGENTQVLSKSGETVFARVSVHPIASSEGDLSLIHLVAKEERALNKELLQSERLAAIAQMVSGLSHESRNSLQSAVACLDLLELDLKNCPEQLELSKRIRESLADIFSNYDQVRRYAEPIRPALKSVNLLDLIQTVFNESVVQRDRVDDVLSFRRTFDVAPIAAVDREQMKLVFHHVIENAMDASQGAAKIDVECFRSGDDGSEMICLRISDQGDGIDDCDLERVFEPFYTTKQHGTGLGLAVCRRIIDAHGGTIVALSRPGAGACIALTVPVAQGRLAADHSSRNGG